MPDATTIPRQAIKIAGLIFDAPAPYHEGHVLTQVEAKVLNQTFSENLRNNFAKTVKDAQEKHGEALPTEIVQALHSQFAEYSNEYEFSDRPNRVPVDPVEREAVKIASAKLREALRKRNPPVDPKTLPEGRFESLVDELLEKYPAIREAAQQRIDSMKGVALDAIDELGV